jgi:hypothetical protein
MVSHPVEHSWTITKPAKRVGTPRRPRAADGPEEGSSPRDARFASQPGAVGTKAMLASLLSMGVIGAAALFLMHSQVDGDASRSQQLAIAEPQATAVSVANLPPTPLPLTHPSVTSLTRPPASSRTSTVVPTAILASPRIVSAPPSRPRPKLPRWHLYPLPVPTPVAAIPSRSAPTAQIPPEDLSDTNPYDEVPATPTTKATAPEPAPRQAADVPSETPTPFGSRE